MSDLQLILAAYCQKWNLSAPVLVASTFTSDVYKVQFQGATAVLKVLNEKGRKFEAMGAAVLRCFDGDGAVRLFEADPGAHLLEFVDGRDLKSVVAQGMDDDATEIICSVMARLHGYKGAVPSQLISMKRNFLRLFEHAQMEAAEDIYTAGARMAQYLLDTERDVRVLHGDIHHENILESSRRGWLVIDPQCLAGERAYDAANAFYNPNGFLELAVKPERILRRCEIFSRRLVLEPRRILEFAFAYGCLSACWCLEDGQSTESTLRVARSIRDCIERV